MAYPDSTGVLGGCVKSQLLSSVFSCAKTRNEPSDSGKNRFLCKVTDFIMQKCSILLSLTSKKKKDPV